MQALPRRSVFALRYKEKCKWCENDRTDGIKRCHVTMAMCVSVIAYEIWISREIGGRHLDIRVTL